MVLSDESSLNGASVLIGPMRTLGRGRKSSGTSKC